MKKLIRILTVLLLLAAIIFSSVWYLFEYDPELTRDFLLEQARSYEQKGRNRIAVWLYELAYHHADQEDSVAIELAQYYKSIGNYSKAEFTLSQAIEDGGSVELYIELSKTFVEQDKLRDAATMLDRVTDPTLKAQLDALRPQAPQASYPTGQYAQYITVELTVEEGTIYSASDMDYPSISTDLYTGPQQLTRGETTFWAITVSDNGLVSSLAEYQYQVEGVVEQVSFTDSAFEEALRQQLRISSNTPLYSDTLWRVTEFTVPSSAASCEDLIWLPNLKTLTISGCSFQDLQLLENMRNLQTLTITDTVVSAQDLQVIASLPSLQKLTLSGCFLSTISNLSGATQLTYLDLSNNSIRNIDALSGMTQLTYLDLHQNALINLEAIAGLTALTTLDVSYNSLVNTAPVQYMTNLEKLDISWNSLMQVDVIGIEQLTGLTWFAACGNELLDIEFLTGATGLKYLAVSNNTIQKIQVVKDLVNLEYLDFSYNEVDKLPVFSEDCPLQLINGGYNELTSLDHLAVLQKLEYVYMDYNSGIKKVDKLAQCPMLKLVNVYGTSVHSVSKLIEAGITVNYTPT